MATKVKKKKAKKKAPGKNKGGRPTKKTEEVVKILLECLTEGMPVDRACDFAMIEKQTFYNWLKKDKGFYTQVRYARADCVKTLVGMVKHRDPWKILRSTDPKNFRDEIAFRESDYEEDDELEKLSDEELKAGAR